MEKVCTIMDIITIIIIKKCKTTSPKHATPIPSLCRFKMQKGIERKKKN